MNKKYLVLIIVVAIVALAGAWYFVKTPKAISNGAPQTQKPANVISATFVCADNITIKADFYNEEPAKVKLETSDGRKLEIPRSISASGARYANEDESLVFWNKGDTAFMQENGQITIDGCKTK